MANIINKENILQELGNPKNWKRTAKKNYDVYVCKPSKGTSVTNKLEGANYVTDDNKQFVISGTVGEQWVIDVNKLAKTYCFMDGSPITPNALNNKVDVDGNIDWMHLKTLPGGGGLNWAFHLPLDVKDFPVQTSWGDTLLANRKGQKHGNGDFLVCADAGGQPNLNDIWVVNGEVFPTTYDMRAFPGLGGDRIKAETPVPTKIISTVKSEDSKGTRGRSRINYQIVGRQMDGKEVTGYYIESIENNKRAFMTKEQICYLIGRDQITNCTAQLVADDVLLRGKGMSLNDLPIISTDGQLRNTDNLGKVRKGASAEDALNQYLIIGKLTSGRKTVGYMIQNAGCGTKRVSRTDILKLARAGKIGNARVQNYNGSELLRGVGINLDELPAEEIGVKRQ